MDEYLLCWCHLQALQELEYPEKLQRLLLTPQRTVLVELVITKDDGQIESFNAYRVQHDDSRGPFKGGLRYHPQVDLDDVRRCCTLTLPCSIQCADMKCNNHVCMQSCKSDDMEDRCHGHTFWGCQRGYHC